MMSKLLTAQQLSAIRIAVCDQRSEWDSGDAAFIQYAESLLDHIDALQGENDNLRTRCREQRTWLDNLYTFQEIIEDAVKEINS